VSLALAARSVDDLETTAASIRRLGGKVITVATDVTKFEDLQRLVETVEAELGPPSLLVNNAGIDVVKRFDSMDPEMIRSILLTNVLGPEWLTRLVLPGMVARRRGHIANMSSLSGKAAVPFMAAYSASKHALVGFSWSLREEVRRHNVGVSVVCPTFVSDVGMYSEWAPAGPAPSVSKPTSPAKVVDAVVTAITKNKAEILVTSGLGKVVDVSNAFSPDLTSALQRRAGLFSYLEKTASTRD
jgi:short-subunit dehydrogenase